MVQCCACHAGQASVLQGPDHRRPCTAQMVSLFDGFKGWQKHFFESHLF